MTKRTVKKELEVPLTAEEVKGHAIDMANHQSELIRMRGEYKDVQREWRERLKHKEGVVQELCNRVTAESRQAFIECEEVYDWGEHIIKVTRTDTGELVETRKASEAEREAFEELDTTQRQAEMFDGDAG